MTDAVVSGSRLFSSILRNSFWLPEKCSILEFGVPRNDLYFKGNELKFELKRKYGFSLEDKILLYAPTFRDDGAVDCYNLDFDRLRATLLQKTKTEWKVIVRLHPNVSHREDLFLYDNNIINGSSFSDQQELCMIADCLITDYSSIMGDFILMKKPVFLFVPDLERYSNSATGRGLREMFFKLPFSLNLNQYSLEEQIMEFNDLVYNREVDSFLQVYYHPIDDGHASERVVDYLRQVVHI